ARELLAEQGYDPVYGARPLKRVIQHLVLDPLAMKIISGDLQDGNHVVIDADEDALTFEQRTHLAA
ncbi:MAG: hypothetical protein KAH38_01415, partial [Candidatus Hydrogenedentes bacterium]|nr:hypothetical protein [Candidatus Hydrogenedentota bacterium]